VELTTATAQLEAALAHQLALVGGDAAAIDTQALFAAMAPALRQLCLTIAEQAAAEVGAQLTEHTVDVVLRDGEPTLVVRASESVAASAPDDLDARLTLRLPNALKQLVEEEAGEVGDSVNSWVVRTLTSRAGRPRPHRAQSSGEFDT
jgi:hypothetical protein